ncbi:hypothetical protein LBP_cg0300 [Lactiplantibacillus plantarum subsp. plantarum P-8]|nr:hypothetical protein LBP_cg0300 [Lactiplantibacillus plantarum subsp. plantarum P-8]
MCFKKPVCVYFGNHHLNIELHFKITSRERIIETLFFT